MLILVLLHVIKHEPHYELIHMCAVEMHIRSFVFVQINVLTTSKILTFLSTNNFQTKSFSFHHRIANASDLSVIDATFSEK